MNCINLAHLESHRLLELAWREMQQENGDACLYLQILYLNQVYLQMSGMHYNMSGISG